MNLPDFLAVHADLTDAEAADAWNASSHRYADAYTTPEGLIRQLGQELADVALGSLVTASAGSPALAFVLDRLRTSEHGINLGDPETHTILRKLGASDLPLSPSQAEEIIETTASTPKVTADDVRVARSTMDDANADAERANRLDSASNAARALPADASDEQLVAAFSDSLAVNS